MPLKASFKQKLSCLFFIPVIALFLCSCAAGRRMIGRLSDLSPDEAVLVGKFVLHPALAAEEQKDLHGPAYEKLTNKFFVINSGQKQEMGLKRADNGLFAAPEWEGRLEAEFGSVFFMAVPKKDLYLYSGGIITGLTAEVQSGAQNAVLSGGVKNASGQYPFGEDISVKFLFLPLNRMLKINPDDAGVYMGTVHLYRDKEDRLVKAEIKDDYTEAEKEFKDKFGPMRLRKAELSEFAP